MRSSVRGYRGRLLLAVLALLVAVVAAPSSSEVGAVPAQPASTYANPVLGGLTANPHVLRAADGAYYAYVNGFDFLTAPVPVLAYRSTDLATWTQVGNVLPTASAGVWVDSSSGWNFTSPSVLHVPTSPESQRYVLYFSAKRAGASGRCIGVATSPSPAGPFTGATEPLICPPGGAQDPSPLPSAPNPLYQQLVYRKNGNDPGIYNQLLNPDGLGLHPNRPVPFLLETAQPTWWHQGVVERPALVLHGDDPYLLYSAGPANTAARAIGWSRCAQQWGIVNGCPNPTHLGSLVAGTDEVASPSGPQVLSDGTDRWLVYDGLSGGSCPTTGPCTGERRARIDKLCFRNGHPRTNAPTATAQPLARSSDCSTDVPGAAFSVLSVTDDGTTVPRPSSIAHRDGGESGVVDGRLVRPYADTLVPGGTPPIVTNTGSLGVPHPSATGPQWATEPVDAGGEPLQLVPFTAEEEQYNQQNYHCSPSPTCNGKRWALWPAGPVPTGGTDTIFFVKLIHDTDNDGQILVDAGDPDDPDDDVWDEDGNGDGYADEGGPFDYEQVQTGAVRVDVVDDQVVVDRSPSASPVACNPTCLFDATVVEQASLFSAPLVAGGFVHLYGPAASGSFAITGSAVARAPQEAVDDRSAWRFWNGAAWVDDHRAAVPLPDKLAFATVEYNAYLDRYVAVGEHIFWAPNEFFVQTAPSPTGPWTPVDPQDPDIVAASCPDQTAYAVNLHAPLFMEGGRVMALSYARPGADWGQDPTCPGQERFVTVRLG